jgi:hypothetical protein
MYAVVRKNTYKSIHRAEAQEQLREFNRRHAEQPGFQGSLSVDIGNDQCVIINLWRNWECAEAALPKMIPVVEQFLEPLFASPSKLIGSGPVSVADLSLGR